MPTILTDETKAGWHEQVNGSTRDNPSGKSNPHLWSADTWVAFEAGKALATANHTVPIKATKSRGYSVRIWTVNNEFLFTMSGKDLEIEELKTVR